MIYQIISISDTFSSAYIFLDVTIGDIQPFKECIGFCLLLEHGSSFFHSNKRGMKNNQAHIDKNKGKMTNSILSLPGPIGRVRLPFFLGYYCSVVLVSLSLLAHLMVWEIWTQCNHQTELVLQLRTLMGLEHRSQEKIKINKQNITTLTSNF